MYITHLGLVEWVSLEEDLEECWIEEEKQEQGFGDHLEGVKVGRSLVLLEEDLEVCWIEEEKQEQVFGDHIEGVKVERSLVSLEE